MWFIITQSNKKNLQFYKPMNAITQCATDQKRNLYEDITFEKWKRNETHFCNYYISESKSKHVRLVYFKCLTLLGVTGIFSFSFFLLPSAWYCFPFSNRFKNYRLVVTDIVTRSPMRAPLWNFFSAIDALSFFFTDLSLKTKPAMQLNMERLRNSRKKKESNTNTKHWFSARL